MRSDHTTEAPRLSLRLEPLTEREQTILRFVSDGLSDKEIARKLFVTVNTIKWYNKRIYSKLDVRNRIQAVAQARTLGLLDDSAGTLPRNNLPVQVTSFIGRRQEIAAVNQILEKSRLLTLSGIGGCGKTRLALQVTLEALPNFSDGAYFIPLAPVVTVDNILWAVAEQMNFRFEVHSEPLKQLLHYLRSKKLLLVLDNFDHLISGAGIILDILQAAPDVKILVTSRERLNLYGEAAYPVPGLDLADAGNEMSESVQLFIERAQSINPDQDWSADILDHVTRICRLVDGMPLGIELAATWIDTLAPQEIADEIEHNLDILQAYRKDVPAGQHSIRAAFEQSWQLLDVTQQIAFRRLSVFRDGFTRDASEAVTGVGLRTLQALVNKSLLRRNPQTGRYEFHELLRHYAQEQLELSNESQQVHQAHAMYFASFVQERWPHIKDNRQKAAVQAVEADIENVRAAWQYWVETGNVTQLNKFLHTLWAVYDIRGWYLAGIELFERGIQVMRSVDTGEARAGLGWLLAVQGLYYVSGEVYSRSSIPAPSWMAEFGIFIVRVDARRGFALTQEGVEILKQLNAYEEMWIIPLMSLFITSCLLDEVGVPLQTAQDCLDAATTIGDEWAIAKAKQLLAVKAIGDADYTLAGELAHEALMSFEGRGDNWSKSVLCTEVLGLLAIRQRQFETAREWMHAGLKAAAKIDFKYGMQTAYWQLGFVATLEEKYTEAGMYWSKALGVAEQILGGTTFLGFGGSSGLE